MRNGDSTIIFMKKIKKTILWPKNGCLLCKLSHMLIGKKYPQNVRVFTMLVEELIRPVFAKHHLECTIDLLQALDDTAYQSRTTTLWVDCLIKPVFVILKYNIRAECEADWALHLDTVKDMVPVFFAAGFVHYARYAHYYLRTTNDACPMANVCNSSTDSTRCTTTLVCPMASGVTWPLKLPSWGMVMDRVGLLE